MLLNLDENEVIDTLYIQGIPLKIGELTPVEKNKIFWIVKGVRKEDEIIKKRKKLAPEILERLNGKVDTNLRTNEESTSFIKLCIKKLND